MPPCLAKTYAVRPVVAWAQWPSIAQYRGTISAIPPYCALLGFWCLNMANWVRYPLPFSDRFPPLESMQSGGTIPLPKRGISAILARYPMKTRQIGAIPPLCDTISKGYCAIRGCISHWAAKCMGGRGAGDSRSFLREQQRGGKGRGKHTIRPCPQTVLDPPIYDTYIDTFAPHLSTP